MPLWTTGAGLKTYTHRTKTITSFEASALIHELGPAKLDLAFVQEVLGTARPIIEPANFSTWNFTAQPNLFPQEAGSEQDFYPWMNWAVCAPAAHAVNTIRDKLYAAAQMPMPSDTFPGNSKTDIVTRTVGGGATNIIHQWYLAADEEQPSVKKPCTPHEFKHVKVLRVGDRSALEFLVEQAGTGSRHDFRVSDGASTLAGKGKRIVCQSINEMVATRTGHSIICTQQQYVMIRLTDGFQLQISRVYQTRNSTTQSRDMAELVLFYAHSALGLGTKYPQGPGLATGLNMLTSLRVTIPMFPTALFQPYEGIFRKSGLNHRTKLVALTKSRSSFFPLPWGRFDGDIQSPIGGDDVTISHGRLVLLFLTARVVAKTAYGLSAVQRLDREFHAYAAMHSLQGVVIPRVVGLYTSKDENSMVLIMSYVGKPLETFGEFDPADRRTLFRRLLRLHQSGIQHNDFEPRNVTMFGLSNPILIDFDNASLDHTCTGVSCGELLQVAEVLNLNLAAELSTLEDEPKTCSNLYIVIVSLLSVLVLIAWGFPRR
ncbi:hypothetical protein DFH07DRAFT_940064 [Mycena maculata]|uniref:Protein kinase domain-containing protein n=1 Tax=Mycena maculata TaxID=230809 RepID=A0AAD7J8Z7_9AGAR|nr:hypothetical protein DFH07DRAFT_940064 [Mycena maculata]